MTVGGMLFLLTWHALRDCEVVLGASAGLMWDTQRQETWLRLMFTPMRSVFHLGCRCGVNQHPKVSLEKAHC